MKVIKEEFYQVKREIRCWNFNKKEVIKTNNHLIKLIGNESGDWKVLKIDDKIYYQGHSIPDFIWLDLLADLCFEVESESISDDDMENGNYQELN